MASEITPTAITKLTEDAQAAKKLMRLADNTERGLMLLAYPSGRRVWYLQMRDSLNVVRKYQLGEYPGMKLKAARDKARDTRHKVRHEKADPVAERRERRKMGQDAANGIGTLRAILDAYGVGPILDRHGKIKQMKAWPDGRKRIDRVFKNLLDKPGLTLTADDFQDAADAYRPITEGNFALRTIRPAVVWATKKKTMAPEAAAFTAMQSAVRKRFLSDAEMARVLAALRPMESTHHAALRWICWTLTRLKETTKMTWGEVDLDAGVWTLAGDDRTKNGEPHRLLLPRQAVELLRAIKPANIPDCALIFPSRTDTVLGNWGRVTAAVHRDSKTTGWHRHDLRRSSATALGDMGVIPDIIEAALNHTVIHSRLAGVYNRARYAPQVGEALQRLADHQDKIVAKAKKAAGQGNNPAAVIPVQKAA